MSVHLTTFEGSVTDAIEKAIKDQIPDAEVSATGGGGHFKIHVVSSAFAGKRMLEQHRLVYSCIKDLMAGDSAPVHAVDSLTTKTPA